MSESTKKPGVGDHRAVADSPGIRRNATDAEHEEGQAGIIESGVWPQGTSPASGMTYDQQLAALDAIMAEWGSTDLNALDGYLNTKTVHDNDVNSIAIADLLKGNKTANDWFLAGINDKVTGKNNHDVSTTIS
jgi:hypothetical protein